MSTTPASELSPAQQKVAELLASGVPLSHAAESAGTSRQTVYNWLHSSPHFAQSIESAKLEYSEYVKEQLQYLSALALKALQQILEDPKASPGIRLRAALAILKRPNSPLKPGWNLPVVLNPEAEQLRETLDQLEAEHKQDRLTKLDTNSTPVSNPAPTPAPTPQIPRSAPCPCGSGKVYKRCCGHNAPPVLHKAA